MADESSADQVDAAASGFRQIVWVRQMLQRWQSAAAASAARRSSASAGGDPDADDEDDEDVRVDAAAGAEGDDDDGKKATPDVDDHNDDSTAATAEGDDDDGKKATPDVDDHNDDSTAATAEGDDDGKKAPAPAESAGRRRVRVVVVQERGDGDGEASGSEPMTPATPDAPADVPRGCCAVYVGAERRRFVVPTAYLGMPVFRRLLEKAEEEFGFDYRDGALTIPCDTEDFKYILVVMDKHQKGLLVVHDEGNPTEAAAGDCEASSSENRG